MMDRYMGILRWSLDRGKMLAVRQGIEGPRSRGLYIVALLLVVLGALAISAIATFQASSLIQGLGLPDLITGGDPDPQGLVKFLATLVGLVQLALALAIGARYFAFRTIYGDWLYWALGGTLMALATFAMLGYGLSETALLFAVGAAECIFAGLLLTRRKRRSAST